MDVAFNEMNQRTGFPAAPAPTWDTIRMILQCEFSSLFSRFFALSFFLSNKEPILTLSLHLSLLLRLLLLPAPFHVRSLSPSSRRVSSPSSPPPDQDSYGLAFKTRVRIRIAREYPEWWEAGLKDDTNIQEEKLARQRDECNIGRGMVDLLPEPAEDDEGEEWGRKERERSEEKAAKERYRVAVMKATVPKRRVIINY